MSEAPVWEIGLLELPRDRDLALFSAVAPMVTNPDALLPALIAIVQFLLNLQIFADAATKINGRLGCCIISAVVQLYVSGELRGQWIGAARSVRATDVWMDCRLIHCLEEQFCENFGAVVALLHLLQFIPSRTFKLLADPDSVTALISRLYCIYCSG
jgi:hypothetical protein